MIAITGSTGQLGRKVIATLQSRAPQAQLVALARSPEKAADLGVPVRQADYDQPETLSAALQGVDTLLLISGSEIGKRAEQHANVIRAAKAQGVQRIVYTSLLRADTSPISLAPEHLATEAALADSGIAHTILRNGWYVENYLASLGGTLQAGALFGAAGQGRIHWATRQDFAEAAVAALLDPQTAGQVFELSGDQGYTLSELAAEISAQTQREIPYNDLSVDDYAALLVQVGLPEPVAAFVAAADGDAAQGALEDEGKQLSGLIGRPTTPLSTSVAQALAALS
ncbi:MAG: SDR family oxidoreductase [Myxococcota bacterium]|nr:SDR family oxidoreductase [Myxococcota bacterium]